MKKAPTIAAVIPLFNGARHIEQAVRSVFAQTVVPTEVIVVDDGSSDEGAGIVERIGAECAIRLISKPNGGQGSARNRGVAESTSELIAFLDQDDAWYPRHIEELLVPFISQANDRLGWAYSNLDKVDEHGAIVERSILWTNPAERPKVTLAGCLAHDMFVLPSASLVSRAAFDAVGGFDERLRGYEDDDLFLRIFRAGYRNSYVDESLSMWRIHRRSASYSPAMATSRMIYLEKLMANVAHEPDHQNRAAVHLIRRRFLRSVFGDYLLATRLHDRAAVRLAAADLRAISDRYGSGRRFAIRAGTQFMRNIHVARILYSVHSTSIHKKLLRSRL